MTVMREDSPGVTNPPEIVFLKGVFFWVFFNSMSVAGILTLRWKSFICFIPKNIQIHPLGTMKHISGQSGSLDFEILYIGHGPKSLSSERFGNGKRSQSQQNDYVLSSGDHE